MKILDICYEIEKACADIYFYYAEVFKNDPEIEALWRNTADEEINHANIIHMARKCREMQCLDKNTDLSMYEDNRDRVLKFRAILGKKTPPSLQEALRTSIKLEKVLQKFHVNNVLKFKDQSTKRLFEALMNGDDKHIKVLEDTYNRLLHG